MTSPVTGYVGDTTLTFSTPTGTASNNPLISIFCKNVNGTPVNILTCIYNDALQEITITFPALTVQTDFIAAVTYHD